ncbi:PH domain-containing protein [Bremerella sp. JC817]|uniref:PH domain-containing protein n=1 Tax=Bremerella sp. JC817 TaxID=3231756 RepID=UPI003457E67F
MSPQVYPAKIAPAITALLAGGAILLLALGVVTLLLPRSGELPALAFMATGGLMQAIWMRTTYTINGSHLVIWSGPIRWRVPLEAITKIEKTSSTALMMGGTHLRFALSPEALMIYYEKRPGQKWFGLVEPAVLISPQNRDEFIQALQEAAPAANVVTA